jgi:glutathione S-transferase
MGADYVDIERARSLPGLRLVLTTGVPGPWGEAAKGMFHAQGIPFVRVAQAAGQANDALFAWTGHRNAPVAMYEDERPRTTWSEILWLAERLRPERSLVPADDEERVRCFGVCHELMGENGFGWSRRLMLLSLSLGEASEPSEAMRPVLGRMVRQYGYSWEAAQAAPARLASILGVLSRQLAAQRSAGRRYLFGEALSVADVCWAAMAGIVSPLPRDVCPMPEAMHALYGDVHPFVAAALDPALLEHRDFVYQKHLEFPLAL